MAVANTKSTFITNSDATPPVLTSAYLARASVRCAVATAEVAAADDDGSVYRMVRVPSNAIVLGVEVLNDALTGGTVYDIGVYQTAQNGGAVVDADLIATNLDMSTARTLPLDATFEVLDIDKVEKRLWELLGLTADPSRDYDICFTADTVGSGAGTLSMRFFYAI